MHFDATMVAGIAFICFLGLMLYLKVPGMVAKGLDESSAAIANELAEAKKLRVQAEELRLSYERQQQQAKSEAAELIKQAEIDAKNLRAKAEAQLKLDIEAKAKAAQERIQRAEQNAIDEVRSFAADKAVKIAQKMLVENASDTGSSEVLSNSIKAISGKLAS